MKTEIKFVVTGGFDIDLSKYVPVRAADGGTVGWEDRTTGETVRLVVALEVESRSGGDFEVITSEGAMADRGFDGLTYDQLDFLW